MGNGVVVEGIGDVVLGCRAVVAGNGVVVEGIGDVVLGCGAVVEGK